MVKPGFWRTGKVKRLRKFDNLTHGKIDKTYTKTRENHMTIIKVSSHTVWYLPRTDERTSCGPYIRRPGK